MKKNIIFTLSFIFIILAFLKNNFVIAKNNYNELNITAKSAILMEKSTGRVLYEKNSRQKMPMASCTKILTAITVIENCDLDELVTIPKEATNIEGSSIYLKEGEKLTVLELLYGLMLRSGNDCAIALAIHTSNEINEFLNLMNKKAKTIGAIDSNFKTPHGLDSIDHYTTAYDLGLISCYALKNDTFSDIVNSKSVKIGSIDRDNARILYNKNKLLKNFEYANGIKTGYTKKAGRCFVGSAEKENMQLVSVVLDCNPMFEESQQLLEYGFNNYKLTTLIPQNKIFKYNDIYYKINTNISIPLKKDGSENDLVNININKIQNENPQLEISFANNLLFYQKLSIIKR